MLFKRRLADHVVIGTDKLLIRRQADFGVDHHLLVARQQDQHVRLKALAIRPFKADLGLILAALFEPGMLKHPLQNQLAPVALGLLPFQGARQVGGFVAQAQVKLLQTLQLFAQREALTGFLLITFFNALFERLNALFKRVEQLAQTLIAGLRKTLFALIKNLAGQFRKLRAQFISRPLQIAQTLLMAFLLLAQFGAQTGSLSAKVTQLGFFLCAFQVPGVGSITRVVALYLQQFDLAAQCRQIGLLGRVGLSQVTDFIAAGVQLCAQTVLSQLGHIQALFEQVQLGLMPAGAPLQLPDERQQRHACQRQAQQNTAQVQGHNHSAQGKKARLTKLRARRQLSLRSCSIPVEQRGHRRGRPDAKARDQCVGPGSFHNHGTSIAPNGFAPAPHLGGQAA